jgi:hypothetical protein
MPSASSQLKNAVDRAGNKALYAVPDGEGKGDSVEPLPVQYPAEIENYRSIGDTPSVLALGLAAGASVALGLTLTASVRRRRRELAMLRALGFTGRQLRATIAWQASVAGVAGVVVGVPLGIVLGRWLWTLFARYINAVPEPTVPAHDGDLGVGMRVDTGKYCRRVTGAHRGSSFDGPGPARRINPSGVARFSTGADKGVWTVRVVLLPSCVRHSSGFS